MANVIDNTIMNYSILWPKGAEGSGPPGAG